MRRYHFPVLSHPLWLTCKHVARGSNAMEPHWGHLIIRGPTSCPFGRSSTHPVKAFGNKILQTVVPILFSGVGESGQAALYVRYSLCWGGTRGAQAALTHDGAESGMCPRMGNPNNLWFCHFPTEPTLRKGNSPLPPKERTKENKREKAKSKSQEPLSPQETKEQANTNTKKQYTTEHNRCIWVLPSCHRWQLRPTRRPRLWRPTTAPRSPPLRRASRAPKR